MTPASPNDERFRRILVATDFSENARKALQWATRLAKMHDATLVLTHVCSAVSFTSLPLRLQEQITAGIDAMRREVSAAGVTSVVEIRSGHPWSEIHTVEREERIDLIVQGARGNTPFDRLALGSTADRVLRLATCPVLTVHPDDAEAPDTIESVLVATDFSEESALATSAAVRLLRGASSSGRLVLMHACNLPFADDDQAQAELNAAHHRLESVANELRSDTVDVHPVTRIGYPARILEAQAAEMSADLIALGTHGRTGLRHFLLGSIAERVLHHANCPVLTVRRPHTDDPVRLSVTTTTGAKVESAPRASN